MIKPAIKELITNKKKDAVQLVSNNMVNDIIPQSDPKPPNRVNIPRLVDRNSVGNDSELNNLSGIHALIIIPAKIPAKMMVLKVLSTAHIRKILKLLKKATHENSFFRPMMLIKTIQATATGMDNKLPYKMYRVILSRFS